MRTSVRNRQGECGSTRSMEWGVGPGGGVPHRGCCPAGKSPRQAHPGRHVAGAGPLSGEGRTMRDPELVARAQRAATRLESAWEQWRALHGLAVAPGQPVVSYVGYSLKDPGANPGLSSGSTPTRPSTWPNSSTAMNAHSADSRSCRSRHNCRRPRSSRCRSSRCLSSRSRSSRVHCSQVRFSRSS